jgi:hypothetical protein
MELAEFCRNRERLAAVRGTALLDTSPEEAFDCLTRLVVALLDVPLAVCSLLDENRQFFKRTVGLPEPYRSTRERPVESAFCQYAAAAGEPLLMQAACSWSLPTTRSSPPSTSTWRSPRIRCSS